MLGFAPFNRPVARVFLGDVGSLPIGLLLGWCLLQLAWRQQFAAALLLPLYYLLDATVTLLRRLARREPFWAAHRSHFYQRATDNGFTVWRVVGEVFALNVLLAALAVGSIMAASAALKIVLLLAGSRCDRAGDVPIFAAPRFVRSALAQQPCNQSGVTRHGGSEVESLRDDGRPFCPRGDPRAAAASRIACASWLRIARLDHPSKVMLGHGQCRLGIGLRHQDDRPADRQQIIEPARHRHAGEIPR